jgi:hypothetical protein
MSKIALSGNASGTGTLTIAAPDTSTDRTLTLPDNSGTLLSNASTAGFPAGSVLQVVSASKTDTQSTSLQAWVDVTGLSVSITPTSATSKMLVVVDVQGSGSNRYTAIRVVRNGTAVGVGDTAGSRASVLSGFGLDPDSGTNYIHVLYNAGGSFLDSPASTSAQTYKVQFGATNTTATSYINRTVNDTDASYSLRGISTITVMEIAA